MKPPGKPFVGGVRAVVEEEREEVIAERAESVFPAGVFLAGLKLVPVGLECVQKGAELTWCESCEPGEGVGLCDELTVEEVGSHAGIVPEDRSLSGRGCFAGDLLSSRVSPAKGHYQKLENQFMAITQKIPATVITGFLGAGKTSLIRHLLPMCQRARIAAYFQRIW